MKKDVFLFFFSTFLISCNSNPTSSRFTILRRGFSSEIPGEENTCQVMESNYCGRSAPSGRCYCDDNCVRIGDCCPDFKPTCKGETPSCIGFCGGKSPDGCWCDKDCNFFEDCCLEKDKECSESYLDSSIVNDYKQKIVNYNPVLDVEGPIADTRINADAGVNVDVELPVFDASIKDKENINEYVDETANDMGCPDSNNSAYDLGMNDASCDVMIDLPSVDISFDATMTQDLGISSDLTLVADGGFFFDVKITNLDFTVSVDNNILLDTMIGDSKFSFIDGMPDISSKFPGTWINISAGSFIMGSPSNEPCRSLKETQYQVILTHSFEIQDSETTQGEFQQIMGYNPSYFSSCGVDCPVELITWHMAAAYCNALSKIKGFDSCYTCTGNGIWIECAEATNYTEQNVYSCPGYRLPTEAEWEYAYRAGTTTAFYSGPIAGCQCYQSCYEPNADAIGWYDYNSGGTPRPVKQKQANAWGLYGMAGNVMEWCHDHPKVYSSDAEIDPWGSPDEADSSSDYPYNEFRVARGGTWKFWFNLMRGSFHYHQDPWLQWDDLGFRCARSID